MSDDAINRQEAIEAIDNWLKGKDYNEAERHIMRATQSMLYDLPSVTPKRKTGYWIETDSADSYWYMCSECHRRTDDKSDYCPNCGCRMVEPQESEE